LLPGDVVNRYSALVDIMIAIRMMFDRSASELNE
jgi:hypothetical protein